MVDVTGRPGCLASVAATDAPISRLGSEVTRTFTDGVGSVSSVIAMSRLIEALEAKVPSASVIDTRLGQASDGRGAIARMRVLQAVT